MSALLRVIGFFLILCGVIGGIILISEIDWSAYRMAKISSYRDPITWTMIKYSVSVQLSLGIISIVSGLISGIFFCSIGTIIDLLVKLVDTSRAASPAVSTLSTNSAEQAAES